MIDMYHMILYIFLLVILFLGNFFTNQSCETWWSNIWPKIPNSWHKMELKLGNTRQIGFEARRTGRGQPCNIIVFSYHHVFIFSYFHIIINTLSYILYSSLNSIIFHILRMKIGFKSEARCWRLPGGSNVLQIGTNFDKLYK